VSEKAGLARRTSVEGSHVLVEPGGILSMREIRLGCMNTTNNRMNE
jgi:hypothetical protein